MADDSIKHLNDYGGANCTVLTIATYLRQRRLDPNTVVVTVNDERIPPDLWDQYNIGNDDRVKVVRAE